jgi:hypothetical protein
MYDETNDDEINKEKLFELMEPIYQQLKEVVNDHPTFLGVAAVSRMWHTAASVAIQHLMSNVDSLDPLEVANAVAALHEAKEAAGLQYAAYHNALFGQDDDEEGEPAISDDDFESAKKSIDSLCDNLLSPEVKED